VSRSDVGDMRCKVSDQYVWDVDVLLWCLVFDGFFVVVAVVVVGSIGSGVVRERLLLLTLRAVV